VMCLTKRPIMFASGEQVCLGSCDTSAAMSTGGARLYER
jgi:hypothetical protein